MKTSYLVYLATLFITEVQPYRTSSRSVSPISPTLRQKNLDEPKKKSFQSEDTKTSVSSIKFESPEEVTARTARLRQEARERMMSEQSGMAPQPSPLAGPETAVDVTEPTPYEPELTLASVIARNAILRGKAESEITPTQKMDPITQENVDHNPGTKLEEPTMTLASVMERNARLREEMKEKMSEKESRIPVSDMDPSKADVPVRVDKGLVKLLKSEKIQREQKQKIASLWQKLEVEERVLSDEEKELNQRKLLIARLEAGALKQQASTPPASDPGTLPSKVNPADRLRARQSYIRSLSGNPQDVIGNNTWRIHKQLISNGRNNLFILGGGTGGSGRY